MEATSSKKKILILGRPKSGKLSLVKALTSSLPDGLTHESTPHAGLTHSITLTTRYYSTEAGIWIDEIPENTDTWLDEYLSEEATPVFQSLAAVILTVSAIHMTNTHDLEILKKLNARGDDVEWEGTCLVVGKQSQDQKLSDVSSLCDSHAFEYVDLNDSGENEFGGKLTRKIISDREKLGLPRVLEVLHTCDWASTILGDDDSIGSLQDAELDFELSPFDDDDNDKQNGSETDVEYMERMMAMLINARGITISTFIPKQL